MSTPSINALRFYEAGETLFLSLSARWQDERQYENIEDYRTVLLPLAMEHSVTIERMTKRPFGCEFTTEGKRFVLKCGASTYSYKRIA
jgi:hypothetical protein